MSRNVEIKATIPDLSLVRARLVELNYQDRHELHQTDTFFIVPVGRLKLREFGNGTGELIYYERSDQPGAKLSEYERVPCENPTAMRTALTKALGIRGVVKKRREVVIVDRTRIHLDLVEGLGSFIELEVVLDDGEPIATGERIAEDFMGQLAIPYSALRSGAYIDLLEAQQE